MTVFDKLHAFKSHIISNHMLFVSPFICPTINDPEEHKENAKLGTPLIHFHTVNVPRHCQRHDLR